MGKAPKFGLDDATLRVMGALVRQPPKPHEEMKLGKRGRKPGARKPGARKHKPKIKSAR